jgi:hypothetical protein
MSKKPNIPFITPVNPVPTKMDQIFMQKEYGGYVAPPMQAPDIPGISTSAPFVDFGNITRPDPASFNIDRNQGKSGGKSLDDLINDTATQSGTMGGGAAFLESQYEGMGRFKSFIPERDNEDANAQHQAWYSKMINGVTKGVVLTGTTFLQTTFGTLNGLAQWANTGKFSSFYDNEFNRALDEISVKLDRELMPTYESKEFRNAAWYSPDYIFTGNFLWEGIVKNLGFAAGAALSGGAIGGAMKGLSAAARLTAVGRANRAIIAAEEAMALGESASGWAGKLAGITKDAGGLSKILDKGYRATVAGLATTGEAGIEAYHNLNEFRNTAIEEYIKENGYAPYGEDLAKINEAADNIGNASFKMNMGLLSVTNYIQFPTILGKHFEADKAIRNQMAPKIKPLEMVDGKAVVKAPSKLQRAGRVIQNPYIFSYSEALEEQGQFVISQFSNDYYNKKYRGDATGDEFTDGINSLKTALGEAFSDEGMKNLLIGGLSGAIMLGPGRFKSNIQKAAATGDAIKKFNESSLSSFIKDTQDSVSRGLTLEQEYLDSIDNDNMLAANQAEQDYTLNYLMPRIKYGRHDLVLADIKDMKALASTEEGFQQLKDEGKIKEGDTVENLFKRLDSLEKTSIAVAKSYQDIGLKYNAITTPDGKRVYPDEVIDKMVYVAAKTKYYNDNIVELQNELTGLPISLHSVLSGNENKLEEAQLAILGMDNINDDQAEDYIEKLNRLAVTKQYKDKMLAEYADIKTNPENYYSKELKEETAPTETGNVTESKTVNVKTKKYPQGKEYEKGKEYVLGNVYDNDSKGNKVFRFPTLTFLGENTDGTLKIKDNKGVERDVSKEVFEDYNLGTQSEIDKSPDARFYQRHANKVIWWNKGKKWGGKIPGRIKWDNKNDNLVFVYNEGGKTKTKVINIDSFKPTKPWFKQGAFYYGKELSVEDNNDIADSEKSGRTAEKIKARQEQRAEILAELYVEVSEKHEATNKLIEKKKKDLDLIKQKLSDLKKDISKNAQTDKRVVKYVRFKKATNDMMAHSLKLSRMITDLENEIASLEDQTLSTQDTLSYIEDLTSSLDSLPDNTKEFLFELKYEQALIDELTVKTQDQIDAIRDLLKSAKTALKGVYDMIANLVKSFQKKFPDVPTLDSPDFIEYLNENRGKLLTEDIEDPFEYKAARESLELLKEDIAYIEDVDVPMSEKRVNDLLDHLNIMEQDMTQLELKARAMQTVIEKFQGIYDTHMAEKAMREVMKLNERIHEEIIGTLDPGIPSNPSTDKYEADSKKDAIQAASSTSVSTSFKEPHVLRANRFAFKFNKLKDKKNIKAVVVTAETQKFIAPGLVEFVKKDAEKAGRKMESSTAIFAVFVRVKKNGSFELVGEDGQELTEAQKKDPGKHAIFQPFPLEDLKAKYPDGKGGTRIDEMFREGTPKEVKDSIRKQYKAWRDNILAKKELGNPISMVPSFGTPIYEQKWIQNSKGEDVQVDDLDAKNSVANAGLITEDDLKKRQTLEVVLNDNTISNNGVVYKSPKGRVFLKIAEGLVPMRANKLSKQKATTVFKVLEKLSKDIPSKETVTAEHKELFAWLRTVVQWGKPKMKKDGTTSLPGYSSVWFDYAYNPEAGQSEPRLFISGLGFNVEFTPSALNENKTTILAALQELHHNVKSGQVNEENYSTEYVEIKDVKEDGTLVTKIWQNYSTYLLSGENRSGEQIPLTTPYKALVEDDDVNRSGIYFTFENAEEMFELEEPVQEEESTTTNNDILSDTALPEERVTTIPVLDNQTDNIYAFSNKKTYAIYRANEKGEITSFQLFDADPIYLAIKKRQEERLGKTLTDAELNDSISYFEAELKSDILKDLVIPAFEAQSEAPKTDTQAFEELPFDELDEGIDLGDIDQEDIELYRIALNEDPYEKTENWDVVEKWTKRNFGNVPFFRVKNLITATKGRKALGMFHKGAIYVYENAEEGTSYHEVFEAIWGMFTDDAEKKAMIDEFKARPGSFEDRETRKMIKYSEATLPELKEALAEEFREFRLKREKFDSNIITRFFRNLLDYIEQFLNWFRNEPAKIEEYFKTIDKGYYKSYNPYTQKIANLTDAPVIGANGFIDIEDAAGDETSEFSIVSKINVPTRELNDVMQHMTFETVKSIFKEDGSLMDTNNYNKSELYFNLKESLKERFMAKRKVQRATAQKYKQLKDMDKYQAVLQDMSKTSKLWKQITDSWTAIIERHVENLQTYNIVFDDNDYVLLNDENNSGREDYLDSRKVDPFKKSSAAIKLLLASIPVVDERGRAKLSSVNGVITMDIGETFLQIMEQVSDAKGIDDMLLRLNNLSSFYPNYRLLYKRLTGIWPTRVNSLDEKVDTPLYEELTKNHFELISSFWRTFKKQKPDIITVFVLQNGETVVTDTSLTSAAKTAQYQLRSSIINSIKSDRAGGLFYTDKGKFAAVTGNNKGFARISLDRKDPKGYSDFLSKFGIEFSVGTIKNFNNSQQSQFFRRVEGIRNELMNIDEATTLNNVTLNIEQDLFKLGILKAITENTEYQSTYFNVNGEMAQTFLGPNALSNLHHTLSSVQNKSELADTEFSYLLTDEFSQNSVLLKSIFDENGDRLPNTEELLKAVFIDGTIDEQNNVKKDSSRLSYIQRVTQEINANLKGIYLNLIPGDASIEWALKLHEENKPFVSKASIDSKDYLSIFKDYLIDEIRLIKSKRPTVKEDNINKLRFFSDILPTSLQTKLLKYRSDPSKVVYSKNSGKFEGIEKEIDDAITSYVENKAKEDIALLKDYNLVWKDKDGNHNVNRLNLPSKMSDSIFKSTMMSLAANYMIANIEMHKVLYGDPYHYSDELKRIKSFSSPRQALLYGSNNLNSSLDRLYNDEYREPYIEPKDGRKKLIDAGWSDMRNPNLRAVTLGDVWSRNTYMAKLAKELESYNNPAEETDGGGIVTIKGLRKIKLRAGMWNERQEAQYKYDIAYEDFYEGRELTVQQLKYFDPQNPLRLNPGVQELYTPIKPIVSGRKGNNKNYNDILLDKFALLPISYRTMHMMSKDSNMLALYKKMQNEFVDYAVFSSGRKVGAEKAFQPYKNGKFNSDPFETDAEIANRDLPQTVINVPFSIISIQTEVPTKEDGGTTQGSQITKLATLDFMEAGVPIDYKLLDEAGNEITDSTQRYIAWTNLTSDIIKTDSESFEQYFERIEDARIERSKSDLYKEIVNNRRILNAKVKLGYKKLISSLGITKDANGNLKITKRDRMASTLRNEIFSRSVNDNVSDSFQGFLSGDVVMEGTPMYQQIRNVLFSIARKNIIRPKINGGFKVQMFNTFFEDNRIEESKDSKGNPVYSTGDLVFYVDEDGKRVCEIMVARWFDSPLSDEEILNSWYVLDKNGKRTDELTEAGKKVVEGIGYRIPTQKQNSIDAFRIKKLLPKEMKDTVIVPTDLVKKVGSDFDIDKLSVYLKNVVGGKNIKALEFLTDENSTPEERYFNWVKDIAGQDSKNYFRFLAKDEVKALKEKFNQIRGEILEDYFDDKDEEKAKYKQTFEELFKDKQLAKTEQDILIKELFEKGKKDFWRLSEDSLSYFENLKQQIIREGLQGPTEIDRYLSLAQSLQKKSTTSNTDKLLLIKVIDNYKEVLSALGRTGKEIQAIQDMVDETKIEKANTIEELVAEVQAENDKYYALYLDAKEEINMTWANEVAAVESLETFDEFKELSIYDQNASKNLDNAYIDSLFNLTTHPLNFNRLVVPNSAKEAKDLSDEIMELQGKDKIDYSAPGNMLSRSFMSSLRHAFVSGKYAIGISAVAQTNHAQNQRTSITLNADNLKYLDSYDAQFLTDTKLAFANHNKLNGEVSLSGIRSADGKSFISDTIGQFIDGYVDISKGPWIMSLGATSNVAGIWLFLLKAGVPLRDVGFFMNQPIIKQYLKELESIGRTGLFSMPVIDYITDEYESNSKATPTVIPDENGLKSMVGKLAKDLDQEQLRQQQFIFKEFLKYAKMSEQLLQYIQGSNFDTSNFNDPLLVFKKEVQLEMARKSIVTSVDDNLQASFVGPLFESIRNARNGFQDILVSDSESKLTNGVGPRDVIQEILRPYVSPYLNDKTFVKLGRKAVENLFDWAMQTGSRLNMKIAEAFFDLTDSKSTVKQMIEFRDTVKRNQNHKMHNNFVINNLMLDPSGRADTVDNVYINAKNNKTFDQNQIINSFKELEEYFQDQNSDMFNKFMRLAILQSGLTNSYLSFTSLLPYETFKSYYNNYISMLPSNPTLKDFLDLNEFQRTNPTNQDIVPVLQAKDGIAEQWDENSFLFGPTKKYWNTATTFLNQNLKDAMDNSVYEMRLQNLDYFPVPKFINIGTRSMFGQSDIVSWYWEDVPLTREEDNMGMSPYQKKQKMIEKGDYSFRRRGLFKKVYDFDENGNRVPLLQTDYKKDPKTGKEIKFVKFVYKAINTRGDGARVQEHYSKIIDSYSGEVLGKRSRITNDFINVKEMSDKKVVEIFNGESTYAKPPKPVPSINAPANLDMSKYPIVTKGQLKEIESLDAKLYPSGRLVLKSKKMFTESDRLLPSFEQELVSLGYTPMEIGAILKLIC